MGYSNKFDAWMIKVALGLSLTGLLMTGGCHINKSEPPQSVVKTNSPQSGESAPLPSAQPESQNSSTLQAASSQENASSSGAATACQRELAALSKINPSKYAAQKDVFENLLKSASVYSTVREDVNPDTKDMMDTLYKYKTQKICNDIEQAINDSLIARGEDVK